MTTNDWIDELLGWILHEFKFDTPEGATPKSYDKVKQAILTKLQEEYKRGYIDGGIAQLTKQEEQK